MKLLGSVVLVKPVEETHVGNIVLPEFGTYKDYASKAKVYYASENLLGEVENGDTILFENNGSEVNLNNEKFLKVSASEVFGVLFGEKATDVEPIRDRIFIEWEHAPALYGKTTILRPATHSRMHYTGTVIAKGPLVDEEINVGDRVFFDQFSNPGKFQDGDKRYAFIKDEFAIAIVPHRQVFQTVDHMEEWI